MNTHERSVMQQALEALTAMLTHMGMDEDEWTKPTFDQAREAITALREALDHSGEATEMVIDWEAIGKEQLRRYKEKFGDFEQAEQEPVGVVETSDEWGVAGVVAAGTPVGTKLYAAPMQQAEQEPVAEVIVRPLRGDQSLPTTDIKWLQKPTTGKLYAAPVRTKDLTDDEIWKANKTELPDCQDLVDFARAVIAKDREKNNV